MEISQIKALIAAEEFIQRALDDAYHRGRMSYLHFSPAWDATAARAAALTFMLEQENSKAEADG